MAEEEPKGKIQYLTGKVGRIVVDVRGPFSSSSKHVEETLGQGRRAKKVTHILTEETQGIEGGKSAPRVPAFVRVIVEKIVNARNFEVSPTPQHEIGVEGSEAYPKGINVGKFLAYFKGTSNQVMKLLPTEQGPVPVSRSTKVHADNLRMEATNITGIGLVSARFIGGHVRGNIGAVYRGEEPEGE